MNQKQVLSPDQIGFYRKNGYLVVDDIVGSDKCDNTVAAYEKYAKPDYRGIMNMDRGWVEYVLSEAALMDENKRRVFVKVVERTRVAPEDAWRIRDMMRHPRIVQILKILQRGSVWGLQTMLLFKKGGTDYGPQAWNPHQDGAYVGENSSQYVTANIAFSDQDRENGCLYIFPGSHREPILPSEKVKSFHESKGQNPGHKVEVSDQYERADLVMKKGSVLFLHGHVIHGSYPNLDPARSRPMLLIPYITKGYSFISGDTARREPIEVE